MVGSSPVHPEARSETLTTPSRSTAARNRAMAAPGTDMNGKVLTFIVAAIA
jgi:hypothetical protein